MGLVPSPYSSLGVEAWWMPMVCPTCDGFVAGKGERSVDASPYPLYTPPPTLTQGNQWQKTILVRTAQLAEDSGC